MTSRYPRNTWAYHTSQCSISLRWIEVFLGHFLRKQYLPFWYLGAWAGSIPYSTWNKWRGEFVGTSEGMCLIKVLPSLYRQRQYIYIFKISLLESMSTCESRVGGGGEEWRERERSRFLFFF